MILRDDNDLLRDGALPADPFEGAQPMALPRPGQGGESPPGCISIPASQLPLQAPSERCYLKGMLAPGFATLVHGDAKLGGKSTFIFGVMASLLRRDTSFAGIPVTFVPRNGHRLLIISEEDPGSIRQSLARFGIALDGSQDEAVRVIHRGMSSRVRDLDEFLDVLACEMEAFRPTVVVVDTLAKWSRLSGDAENTSGAMQAAVDGLMREVCARDVGDGLNGCLCVIHHDSRAGRKGHHSQAARGSTALIGAVDALIQTKRGADGLATLKTEGRLGEPSVHHVRLRKHESGPWEYTRASGGPTEQDEHSAIDRAVDSLLWALDWLRAMERRPEFDTWRNENSLKARKRDDGYFSRSEIVTAIRSNGQVISNDSLSKARQVILGHTGRQVRAEVDQKTRSIRLLPDFHGQFYKG